MRTFWIIIALLVAATAWLWFGPSSAPNTPTTTRAPSAEQQPTQRPTRPRAPEPTPPPAATPPAQASPAIPEGLRAKPIAAMIMGTQAPVMPIDWIERDPFFLRRVEAAGSSTANGILVNGPSSTNPFRVTGDIDPSHTPRPGESADPSASAQRTAGGGGALGSEMAVELEGQSLTVRGKPIPGDGTADNPYIIPWGLLVSAARTYQPDQGAEDLPSWTEALEGRFVMLTGFAFLPTFQTASQDMLLMLNEWDGCCIGVPPTPYDSIEVTLTEPAALLGRSNYVSVKGQLSTDPYLVRGWLVGLYLLDDAELVVHEN